MFLALVIMAPLFCLSTMIALNELQKLFKLGIHIEQVERIGYMALQMGIAGAEASRLPGMVDLSYDLLRPLFDVALAVSLLGVSLMHAGRRQDPVLWLQISAVGFLTTLAVWMVFAS